MDYLEILRRWHDYNFLEKGIKPPQYPSGDGWANYHDIAQVEWIRAKAGGEAEFFLNYGPGGTERRGGEAEPIEGGHVHPGDRILTLLEGSGRFLADWNGKIVAFTLEPGNRLYMPRGVYHNFVAGPKGAILHVIANPFVEDALALIVPNWQPLLGAPV